MKSTIFDLIECLMSDFIGFWHGVGIVRRREKEDS